MRRRRWGANRRDGEENDASERVTKHAETSGTKKGLGVATLNIYLCSAEPANVTIFATSSPF